MLSGHFQPATFEKARESRGMTLADVASRTGMSSMTVSRIEQGLRDVDPHEASLLAEAVKYPTRALYEPLPLGCLGLPTTYHRKLSAAGAKIVRSVEARCLMASIGLRNLVKLVESDHPDRIPRLQRDDYGGDPEKAAAIVRLQWQVPRGPIVDLIELVERAGGFVIHCDFGIDKMDALYQPVPQIPPLFWMNSNKPFDRARFSLAHELGHVVLHHAYTEPALAEREADQFASALLMPRSDFRTECAVRLDLPILAQLKKRWRVSMAAIVRRAKDLNVITEAQYRGILIRMGEMRKAEPFPIAPETPRVLADLLAKFAASFGCASFDQTAEALRIPVDLVAEWQQLWPGFASDGDAPRMRLAL